MSTASPCTRSHQLTFQACDALTFCACVCAAYTPVCGEGRRVATFGAGRLTVASDGLQVFEGEGCRMVEMSCEEHDRIAASTQFMTHTVGRILGSMALAPTAIDTKGFQSLLSLVDNTTHDSFDLYYGLFMYNAVRSRTSTVTAVLCIGPVYHPNSNPQVYLDYDHGHFPDNEVHRSYEVIHAPAPCVSKHRTIRTQRAHSHMRRVPLRMQIAGNKLRNVACMSQAVSGSSSSHLLLTPFDEGGA